MSATADFAVTDDQLFLQRVWARVRADPDGVYMVQPLGGGRLDTYTWARTVDEARRLAAFLRAQGWADGSRVALISKNCAQHYIMDLAIWMAGLVPVAVYPTLDADTLRYTLEHCDAKMIFCGKLDDTSMLDEGVPPTVRKLRCDLSPDLPGAIDWQEILNGYAPIEDEPVRARDDAAMLVYTSGSTGRPKGVQISFAASCVFAYAMQSEYGFSGDDRMMSYLPLGHAFERSAVEIGSMCLGFRIFFAESLDTFLDDVKRSKPTVFLSVPRLWMKMKSGVEAKLPPAKLRRLLRVPIVGGLVRKKILDQLGLSQVRFGATGTAPIPTDVLQWYADLGLEIVNGFGMTELSGGVSATRLGRADQRGTVGPPFPGTEARVRDGELQVRSVGLMTGYYRAPELTAAAFTEDGWFRTGDQASIEADGSIRITGRVKELFKTSKGKYVAPAPIEGRLDADEAVEQSCVMGLGLPQPFAVITLSEGARAAFANGGRQALLDTLETLRTEVNAGLQKHERLSNLVVARDEWAIANGLLTPTMKIKRAAIEARYAQLGAETTDRGPGVRVEP